MKIREELVDAVAGNFRAAPHTPSIVQLDTEQTVCEARQLREFTLRLSYTWKVTAPLYETSEALAHAKQDMVDHIMHDLYKDVVSDLYLVMEALHDSDCREAMNRVAHTISNIRRNGQ